MTIGEYFVVAGVLMPDWKVYQHMFETSVEFREQIRTNYVEMNPYHLPYHFTWEEFEAFVPRLEAVALRRRAKRKANNDDDVDDKEDKMWGTYRDSEIELDDQKWVAARASNVEPEARLELDIFHVTHDVDEDTPYVVGLRVFGWGEPLNVPRAEQATPMLGAAWEVITQIQTAERAVEACGFMNVRLYQVQDDCGCCS